MPQVTKADDLTADLGTDPCRQFRRHIFSDLSTMAMDLALRYVKTAERYDYERANQELSAIHESLCIDDLNLCTDTEELKKAAYRCAAKCRLANVHTITTQEAYQACLRIVDHYRITPPTVKNDNLAPVLNRMSCPRWWFRKIKVLRLRTIEGIARNIELVNRCRATYASDYAVSIKRKQKKQNRLYLESTFICNELGESYSLQELADRSVSNPAIRRAELMVRIKGFEIAANMLGHVGEFYTLTTPSRMHACLHHGQPNPHHDGTTPLQAHEHLTHLWALIRAELHRQNIRPYGFRVVEPHHDGTPHWHLLLFLPNQHRETVRAVMRHYALADSCDEPGAQEHRFKAVAIDPAKGTAAGYIAKYIAKNIDGHALEQDLYGNKACDAAERITTWANTWGIRQFQQIGGPSVMVWRQLRKMDKADEKELESIRQTATASDWAAFMLAMGGYELPRSEHSIKPFYDHSKQLDPATGEITLSQKDYYGDAAPLRVAGVTWKGKQYDTRKHFWMIFTPDSEASPARSATEGARRDGAPELSALSKSQANEAKGAGPWTCINNCTNPQLYP